VLRLASLILAVTLSLRRLAPGDDLLVGLLRSDGIVLPFARFANGAWSPAALDSSRAPTSDEMPRPSELNRTVLPPIRGRPRPPLSPAGRLLLCGSAERFVDRVNGAQANSRAAQWPPPVLVLHRQRGLIVDGFSTRSTRAPPRGESQVRL